MELIEANIINATGGYWRLKFLTETLCGFYKLLAYLKKHNKLTQHGLNLKVKSFGDKKHKTRLAYNTLNSHGQLIA